MLTLFASIKNNITLKPKTHCIDNWIFQLHYRVTTVIFLIATLLVSSREYIGEHIRCINDMKNEAFTKVIERYCFFTSTFTVVKDENIDRFYLGYAAAHPGVSSYGIGSSEKIRMHSYYQWVPFVLFGQSIMFYLTHLLWKKLEDGRIYRMVESLDHSAFALLEKEVQVNGTIKIPSKESRDVSINRIKEAFLKRIIMNKSWAWWLIFCEILNVLHVILQICMTHSFLGKQFYNLGPNLLKEGSKSLDVVFPKMTKCTFHKYGPSGSIQHHDALCVMALNIINEKIYVFLWFWFVVLLTVSGLVLIWRLITIILYKRSPTFNKLIFNNSKSRLYSWHLMLVTKHCSYPDWLLLKYLSKNMSSLAFRELFLTLFEDLEEKKPLYMFEKGDVTKLNKSN